MGRVEYLNRLALGRSAFQSLEQVAATVQQTEDVSCSSTTSSNPEQRYDNKGRPRSEEADSLNARLREAQNAILALVNIVERNTGRDNLDSCLAKQEVHRQMHTIGHRSSSIMLADFVTLLLTWYPQTLVKRILVGDYYDVPLTQVILQDLAAASTGPWRSAAHILFPGLEMFALHTVLSILLANLVRLTTTSIDAVLFPGNQHGGDMRDVEGALQATGQLALLPVLQFSTSTRLGMIRPEKGSSDYRMLLQLYSLCDSGRTQRQLWRRPFTMLTLPWLVSTESYVVSLPALQDTNRQQRDCSCSVSGPTADASEAAAFALMRPFAIAKISLARARWTFQTLLDRRSVIKHHVCQSALCNEMFNALDEDYIKDSAHLRIPSLAALTLYKFARLPLEYIALRSSARTFIDIFGPAYGQSGYTRGSTLHHHHYGVYSGADACLHFLSRLGLAVGICVAVEASVRGIVYAWQRIRANTQAAEYC